MDASPRSATVVAKTACRVVPIGETQFHFMIRETPHFASTVIAGHAVTSAERAGIIEQNQTVGWAELASPTKESYQSGWWDSQARPTLLLHHHGVRARRVFRTGSPGT